MPFPVHYTKSGPDPWSCSLFQKNGRQGECPCRRPVPGFSWKFCSVALVQNSSDHQSL